MTEIDYSKRELDEKFTDIKESLNRIEAQTTRHNGRLSKAEKWIYTMAGAIAILAFLLSTNILAI